MSRPPRCDCVPFEAWLILALVVAGYAGAAWGLIQG